MVEDAYIFLLWEDAAKPEFERIKKPQIIFVIK